MKYNFITRLKRSMPFRSSLFRRNNGGLGDTTRRRTSIMVNRKKARSAGTLIRRADPHPPPSRLPITSGTVKATTTTQGTIACNNVTTTPGVLLDTVVRGDEDDMRNGSKWRGTALHLRGTFAVQTDPVSAGYYVVWDKAPDGALATWAQVFDLAGPFAFANEGGSGRFRILHKKSFDAPIQALGGDNTQQTIDDYIQLPAGLVCHSAQGGNGTGVIGERSIGALLLFGFSDAVLVDQPTITVSSRYYFADL